MPNKRILFSIACALVAISSQAWAARPDRPNIVLILADDLGWQDVKCYDVDEPSPMETPHMDALAQQGLQFWQAYAPAPTCAPSRAAILSGDHPARAQMTHVAGGKPPHAHSRGWSMLSPWYTVRMPAETVTLAEALKANGYTTGHSGKWHVAMRHHGYPQPEDQGFDYTRHSRGVQTGIKNRLADFASSDPKDPYRLDSNGFPYDQTTEDALTFVRENSDQPFFLYFATWLVHTPVLMRSEELLRKYERKLGVEITQEHQTSWSLEGQMNPFYCAMVEQFDYYIGRLIAYLENTDDPRWPGHKLIENTYILVTSDNGGMEGYPGEIITDNFPLDRGKLSAREGGTRVPLIIAGPDVPHGVQSDVMVNGLDFYPTLLALTGTETPAGKQFDGLDISTLLLTDPTDPSLVRTADGAVRDTLVWHFPNSAAMQSAIRVGDYKLIRNYSAQPELELYRLYDSANGRQGRADIEEANNLALSMPDKTATMNARLTEILTEMKASFPYYNPYCPRLPKRNEIPAVLSDRREGDTVYFAYEESGADVVRANLIYTRNGGDFYEEWFREPATLLPGGEISAQLPAGTTHYFINLIDSNNFLVSYPKVAPEPGQKYSTVALPTNLNR